MKQRASRVLCYRTSSSTIPAGQRSSRTMAAHSVTPLTSSSGS
jgi:hypothetical protein